MISRFEELQKVFSDHGSELLGFVSKKTNETHSVDENNITVSPTNADKAIWACKECKGRNVSIFSSLMRNKRFMCKSCSAKASGRYKNVLFTTMDELKGLFTNNGSVILGYISANSGEFVPIEETVRMPRGKEKARWNCRDCGVTKETTLFTVLKNNVFKCYSCSAKTKKAPPNKYGVDYYLKVFLENGSRLIDYPEKITSKSKVKWECSSCKREQYSGIMRVVDNGSFMCRSCGVKKTKNEVITFDTFETLVDSCGFLVVSPKSQYENTKSVMRVKCVERNHEFSTSYNSVLSRGCICVECNRISRSKKKFKEAKQSFESLGYTILGTEIPDNQTPVKTKCTCGRIFNLSYGNVLHKLSIGQTVGKCSDCTRRWTISGVRDYCIGKGCIFLQRMSRREEDEFVLNEDVVEFFCFCGNQTSTYTTWRSFTKGVRCTECTKTKRGSTNVKIYGYKNAAESKVVKQKIKGTMEKNWAGGHNMRDVMCVQKAKKTNMRNHGGVHNFNLPHIREDAISAYYELTGYQYPLQNPEVREKSVQSHLERTGVAYPMQNPVSFSKKQQTSFSSKPYIFLSGKVVMVQGYEHFAIDELLDCNVSECNIICNLAEEDSIDEEVPVINYEYPRGKSRRYYPDIFVLNPDGQNKLIEVKSTYTLGEEGSKLREQNIAKFKAASQVGRDQGYVFELWVYDNDGKKLETVVY